MNPQVLCDRRPKKTYDSQLVMPWQQCDLSFKLDKTGLGIPSCSRDRTLADCSVADERSNCKLRASLRTGLRAGLWGAAFAACFVA